MLWGAAWLGPGSVAAGVAAAPASVLAGTEGFALFFPFPLRGAGEAASLLASWGEAGGEGVSGLLPAFPAGSWGVGCSSAAYPCAAFLAARAILLRAFRWSLTS